MSGIGHTVWQVENNPKLHPCLAAHWPHSQRYHDVREVGRSTLAPVDLICGGFPCQDVSSAGARAGLAGARSGLWYEFARVVEEMRPRWVVVENVASGANKWVDTVRRGLERIGYGSLPIPIAASDLGAPHERARVFIIAARAADDDNEDLAQADDGERRASESARSCAAAPDADSERLRLERGRVCGPCRAGAIESPCSHADVDVVRELQPTGSERNVGRWTCDAPRIWATEPDVARMVHGLPGRVDREHSLGNSVVPQQAEVVGYVIRELTAARSASGSAERKETE